MKTENWFPLLPGDDGGSIFPSLPDFCGVRTFMGVELKWPTVHWRENWKENLSVQVQWLRAARQECRDLITVCVPVHAFYITLFLAQVCSDIKGQYKSPFEYAFFGIWCHIHFGSSHWQDPASRISLPVGTGCERTHGLLYFMYLEKLRGEKNGPEPQDYENTLVIK